MAKYVSKLSSETKAYAAQEAERLKKCNNRMHEPKSSGREASRPAFETDYARILHSTPFRRLQGKMQLLGVDHTHFVRNRLTHSLEVAQTARHIAVDLDMEETLVAEACSLAHDMGNPPFGHHGETVLHELATGVGGFEGNAQTFRILARLEKKHPEFEGLNLTLRTMLGVVKRLQRQRGGNRKFLYEDDYDLVSAWINEETLELGGKAETIDMQVMDLADEIAYASHDLDDCLTLRHFTADELLYEFLRHPKYTCVHGVLNRMVMDARKFAGNAYRLDTADEYAFLFRRELTSEIAFELVGDIRVSEDKKKLEFGKLGLLAEGLKELTFSAVLNRPNVQHYEMRGEKVIRGLFEVYSDKRFNPQGRLLPARYRDPGQRTRHIADYIAGMMDSFAIHEYEKFFGLGTAERI